MDIRIRVTVRRRQSLARTHRDLGYATRACKNFQIPRTQSEYYKCRSRTNWHWTCFKRIKPEWGGGGTRWALCQSGKPLEHRPSLSLSASISLKFSPFLVLSMALTVSSIAAGLDDANRLSDLLSSIFSPYSSVLRLLYIPPTPSSRMIYCNPLTILRLQSVRLAILYTYR